MSRQIIVEILGDASKFDSATKHATKTGTDFSNVITGIGQGLGHGLVSEAGRAMDAVADFVSGSISKASNLNETINKSQVVFGDSATAIEAWGSAADRNLGMSQQAAMEAAATFGNLFEGAGLAADGAATLSKGVVQLAADLGSVSYTHLTLPTNREV